jgi:alpha-glucosidase
VYVRSFADANGDGVGDLAGVRARLPYLAELGVDALWYTPWYRSPFADGGYDVADYREIDPALGTLAEAEKLIAEAADLGLRTIVDIVPNHVSSAHRWFRAALAAGPGSPERTRFFFRPGRGEEGELPPNDWQSQFGGPAWTPTGDGEWYLHRFAPEQPDLDWTHPDVRREHEEVLRFWFDRGAAGVRIDSAAEVVKDPGLPDLAGRTAFPPGGHPYIDRDGLHELYRGWRVIADSYHPEPRALIGELWLPDADRFAHYLRPDELPTAFKFDFLTSPWAPDSLREVIGGTLERHAPVGAPPTWVLSNHDVTRHVTRYGRSGDTGFSFEAKTRPVPATDLVLGTRRARAAALLALALPGAVYLYQGEELGLPEVEDPELLPDSARQDPMFHRSNGSDPGRDGCRIPLPWSGDRPPYGFSPPESAAPAWLPQPPGWGGHSAEAQSADGSSMLNLYRAALRLRRDRPALRGEEFAWLPEQPPGVLAFTRGRARAFACVVNLSSRPVPLPADGTLLLSSEPLPPGELLPDTAAWLALPPVPTAD